MSGVAFCVVLGGGVGGGAHDVPFQRIAQHLRGVEGSVRLQIFDLASQAYPFRDAAPYALTHADLHQTRGREETPSPTMSQEGCAKTPVRRREYFIQFA